MNKQILGMVVFVIILGTLLFSRVAYSNDGVVYLPFIIKEGSGNVPPTPTAVPTSTPTPNEPQSTAPLYGVNFISSAETNNDEVRYQNGLNTGASWNRWPFYWHSIEATEGNFNWSSQDSTVLLDLAHGLKIDGILLGTPGYYRTGLLPELEKEFSPPRGDLQLHIANTAAPRGLWDGVFTDGSDTPGVGKTINPNNVWARFVFMTVSRYKPGGELANAYGWAEGVGVTHWEMWNEPDLDMFWDGTVADYARLLKVGYMAAKHADPEAQILFGGVANSVSRPTYYKDVMEIYDVDPLAIEYAYFHDIAALHNYANAWDSWLYVYRINNVLKARGLQSKQIWLNEHGVPLWDEYPGPVWDPNSPWHSTEEEQADYLIQSSFYALYAGADALFPFQLYDGCGNQPQGTNFPPHNGELCEPDGGWVGHPGYTCYGDAFGLLRNRPEDSCFAQHPEAGTARLQYQAVQVLTQYVRDVVPLWRSRPGSADPYNGPQEWIALERPATKERVLGMWARFGETETAVVPATHTEGLLIMPDGSTVTITPTNGVYTLTLVGATNQNYPDPPSATYYLIGGRPLILIEPDTRPPLIAASIISVTTNTVQLDWSADDWKGLGLKGFTVTVNIDNVGFVPWINDSLQLQATYPISDGHQYQFKIEATDRALNISEPVLLYWETGVQINSIWPALSNIIRRDGIEVR